MQLDESRFEIEDLKDEMTKAQDSLQRKVENVSSGKKETTLALALCFFFVTWSWRVFCFEASPVPLLNLSVWFMEWDKDEGKVMN